MLFTFNIIDLQIFLFSAPLRQVNLGIKKGAIQCEWIDTVPINKISAFGGDFCTIDGVYEHPFLARENVSRALALKVEQGLFDCEKKGKNVKYEKFSSLRLCAFA